MLRLGRGLARNIVGSAKAATPERGGAGGPIKLAPRPDKPVSAPGVICLHPVVLGAWECMQSLAGSLSKGLYAMFA